MKKKTTLALALAMILSLSACGNKTETAESTAPETEVTTAADETADETQADTKTEATTEETTAETEVEAVVHADIEEASPCYYGGVMFKTTEKGPYYYRFSDKKLFDLSEYEFYDYSTASVSGSVAITENKIINIDTNETLYDLSDGTVSKYGSANLMGRHFGDTGSFAITSSPKGFDDNPVIIAMKNDGSIIGEIANDNIVLAAVINDRYIQTMGSNNYVYDAVTGENLGIESDMSHYGLENDKFLYFIDYNGNAFRYNKSTGASEIVLSSNDYSYTSSRGNNAISNYMDIYGFNEKTNKLSVIDTETDSVVDFDLSSFAGKCDNGVYPLMACSDYTVVDCHKSNTHYIAMLDKNGNTFFEPIAISYNEKIYYSENYFVCCDGENSFVVDTNTKTVTYPDEGLSIESYDTMGSDILVIKDSDGNYFLANAATPNDLYSPFDDYVQ